MPENKLLLSLPAEERGRLEPYLEPVSLEFDQVLVEFGRPIEHVYFLGGAVTCTVVRTPDGDTVEVGLMGAEGFVGLSLVYGVERSNGTVVVQLPGGALRMRAADFKRHVKEPGGPCLDILLRYANYFAVMVQQHAACNAKHVIEERMCRWILLTHDRVGRDEFPLTQDFLSQMLGVRRAGVNEAQRQIQDAGAISYVRGIVTVLDRGELERLSCECYPVIRAEHDRVTDFGS